MHQPRVILAGVMEAMDREPEVRGREESMISDMYITKSDISFKESNLYHFSCGRGKYLYTIL